MCGFVSNLKLYVVLVLVPQTLWLLSDKGLPVLCDSCSFLPPHLPQHQSKSGSVEPTTLDCYQEPGADNLTHRLCSCGVDSGPGGIGGEGAGTREDARHRDSMMADTLGGW